MEMKETVSGSTVADTGTIDLQTRTRDIYSFRLLDGTLSRKLIYIPLRKWDQQVPLTSSLTTARPTHYTFYKNVLEMYRIPDAAYSYKIRRAKYVTAFDADSDVVSELEEKDDILIALAMAWAFHGLGEKEKANSWFAIATNLMGKAVKEDKKFSDFESPIGSGQQRVRDYWLNPFTGIPAYYPQSGGYY